MTSLDELIQAALGASPDRRDEALRVLQGNAPKPEQFLTLRGLARKLGFGVTTLRRWRVPGHDLGGPRFYRLSEVEAYLTGEGLRRRQAALRAERRAVRASDSCEFGGELIRPARRQPPQFSAADRLTTTQ